MKKNVAVLVSLLAASPVFAEDDSKISPYLGATLGFADLNVKAGSTEIESAGAAMNYAIVAGLRLSDKFAVEFDYTLSGNHSDNSAVDLKVDQLFANLKWGGALNPKTRLYGKFGVGKFTYKEELRGELAEAADFADIGNSFDFSGIGYRFGLGVDYKPLQHLAITGGVDYTAGDLENDDLVGSKLKVKASTARLYAGVLLEF
ncbi:Uncharacterised protein [BD1-7 clade bacterium]|uniref:Outer membrane protein beta-barrel domain-containing protein n=1 Tax=BD1-7 clade bacterium TaxID=2029982 RepID=A0A5S9Q094_9GAMM|nr:Uncharacterised protein [BD1-7 clade bacterium]CAA0112677.1 Uncharacterised protein [BD1-7 clade bacterium]